MRTYAIMTRVLKELIRDKRTLALMFIAPIFILILMNLIFFLPIKQLTLQLEQFQYHNH